MIYANETLKNSIARNEATGEKGKKKQRNPKWTGGRDGMS
jgi:hypothetical protein